MICPSCTSTVPDGARFCTRCGNRLDRPVSCAACGSALGPDDQFCGECGHRSRAATTVPESTVSAPPAPRVPMAERRRCSILFVDLVGFTEMAEGRDVEEVRELLAGYFDLARTVVGRYGGLLEKFIGDAVMAVWGAPTAHDDDSERAVRAAMDIVESVREYGASHGVPLAARAGVVTDSVAVTVGAEGQGVVAGDPVNTAARVQSAAEPGSVLADTATRRQSEAAIAYADAGTHELKGKAVPMLLHRAVRVVAGLGGSDRVDGLEPGFLGRERELRTVKEAFHAAADVGRAALVSVVGLPGVGKTRLKWEFEKYVDGLADTVLWHDGRCLPYGDGVAYWALAQMVRYRLGINEDDGPETVAQRLAEGLGRYVPDAAERRFLEPRLGALLTPDDPELTREELFAGWRLWFERLAEQNAVVLVVDDLQWADPGLLDFCEHLLEWATDSPIFLLTLGRPELLDRRPGWGSGRRSATALALDPLTRAAMETVLDNLVPDLPDDARTRIVEAADGVPLYAVELVRALVDRDVIQPQGGSYRLVGEVTDLAVPASLTSLITSRIDGLPATERTLVGGLAVLGTTFPRAAVAAVTSVGEEELSAILASLVRREILTVRSERTSPERGQYAFTQTLMRTVAYETLSRHDRRARHLDVARHLRAAFSEDGLEVVEVVAEHYRDAYLAVPESSDADEVRREAIDALGRAGARAMSIGAPVTASRAYRAAAELVGDDADERAGCLQRAGEAAEQAGLPELAAELLAAAAADHETAGRPREAAWCRLEGLRCTYSRGVVTDDAVAAAIAALPLVTAVEDELAVRARNLVASLLLFTAHPDEGMELVERALELAQALDLPRERANAATMKGVGLSNRNRNDEALVYYTWAIDLAHERGLKPELLRALVCASDLCMTSDRPGALDHTREGIGVAQGLGNRQEEMFVAGNLVLIQVFDGDWDGAQAEIDHYLGGEHGWEVAGAESLICRAALLSALRGDLPAARTAAAALAGWDTSREVQARLVYRAATTVIALAGGDRDLAVDRGVRSLDEGRVIGFRHEAIRVLWPATVEAALRAGRLADAESLVETMTQLPAGILPPYLKAEIAHYRARLAAATGVTDGVADDFAAAEGELRRLGYPYFLARVLSDHGAWLLTQGLTDDAGPLLAEARELLTRLGARPALEWLERDSGQQLVGAG